MLYLQDLVLCYNFVYCCLALTSILIFGYVVPYVVDSHRIRSNTVKGPLFASFSDAWLIWITAGGHRSEIVHDLHKTYGTFVRLAPNHVSVSDPRAIQAIYGHGNGALKSDFYDAFVSTHRGIFSTRSSAEHARKRRLISHMFSQRSIRDFEPIVRLHVRSLISQWDRMCSGNVKDRHGNIGKCSWREREGKVWFDCLPWYNYLAFDIIGELALGTPFGMIEKANDSLPVISESEEHEFGRVSAIDVLSEREEHSTVLGCMPPLWRPLARLIPWLASGNRAAEDLTKLADRAVTSRLSSPKQHTDILSRLQASRDDDGLPMKKDELVAETITQLIAGSESTSSTICAITYYLAQNPQAQAALQRELDDNIMLGDNCVAPFDQFKCLPYLESVVNEAFRVYSTSGLGLPREAPLSGLSVLDKTFPKGTVLSVPSYTVHRCEAVWGEDVETFRPERWFEGNRAELKKALNPFSFGPRACLGRNLAVMELLVVTASIFRRYELTLQNPNKPLDSREGFLRRPLECSIGLRRRDKSR